MSKVRHHATRFRNYWRRSPDTRRLVLLALTVIGLLSALIEARYMDSWLVLWTAGVWFITGMMIANHRRK